MRVGAGGGIADEGEDIEVLELPIDSALAMIADGRIADAKTIMLSLEAEPEIYYATLRFGSVLENVCFDPETRLVDFDDQS